LSLAGTLYHFAIGLSDVDRGVYETLELKVARHPSEAQDHLVARALAYEPALRVRDLTGRLGAFTRHQGQCRASRCTRTNRRRSSCASSKASASTAWTLQRCD
jgi:hypothetical protein